MSNINHNEEKSHQVGYLLGPNTMELLGIDRPSEIQVLTPWHRGGAETYISDFQINRDRQQLHLIAKACIKFGATEATKEWVERRKELEVNGVALPKLYFVERATIVEEYIPFSFKEAYEQADETTRNNLGSNYIDTFKRVFGAGFTPMSFHDVRSRGEDAVVIDVGEDLGPSRFIDACSLSVCSKAVKSLSHTIG
jgi:hypothetical protein